MKSRQTKTQEDDLFWTFLWVFIERTSIIDKKQCCTVAVVHVSLAGCWVALSTLFSLNRCRHFTTHKQSSPPAEVRREHFGKGLEDLSSKNRNGGIRDGIQRRLYSLIGWFRAPGGSARRDQEPDSQLRSDTWRQRHRKLFQGRPCAARRLMPELQVSLGTGGA